MAFKTFAALIAVALVALAPVQETNALSLPGGHSANLISRVPHSSLIRRQNKNKTGKNCKNHRGHGQRTTSSSSSSQQEPTSTRTTATPPKPTKAVAPNYKAGMIFNSKFDGFLRTANNAVGGKLDATYNWGPIRSQESIETGVEFIPTFWGERSADDWGVVKKGYCKRVFAMNEVNQPGQSTMSVERATELWNRYLVPLISQGIQLYSPSTSNAPSGFDWYERWFEHCPKCKQQTSALNIHIYSNNPDNVIDYVKEAHERFGLPIYISEMGCANWSGNGGVGDGCSAGEVVDWINKVTGFLNSQSWVVGYMFFGFFPPGDPAGGVPSGNALYTSGGGLSEAGRAYLY